MSETLPKRIQLRRTAGWRMPPNCVKVDRSTRYGNPWSIPKTLASGLFAPESVPEVCIRNFEAWLTGEVENRHPPGTFPIYGALARKKEKLLRGISLLRGHDLACWCKLCDVHRDGKPLGVECSECAPCHADILLAISNGESPT